MSAAQLEQLTTTNRKRPHDNAPPRYPHSLCLTTCPTRNVTPLRLCLGSFPWLNQWLLSFAGGGGACVVLWLAPVLPRESRNECRASSACASHPRPSRRERPTFCVSYARVRKGGGV